MRAALEAALVDNPDDRATHMAYADWLAEQGDPRGELIQVQLALEDETRPAEERKRLQQREQELLEAHQREWLGGLATYLLGPVPEGDYDRDSPGNYLFRFARGWLHSLTCRQLHVAVARAVARAPEVRLLRQFAIEYVYWYDRPHEHYEEGPDLEGVDPNYPGLGPLRHSPYLGNVRVFQLGEPVDSGEDDLLGLYNCHTRGSGAVELIGKMPRLEELYLLAHDIDTDRLFTLPTLPHLRILQVYHLHHYPLDILAANPALGRLTHLLLHPGGQRGAEPHIRLDGLQAIARSPHLRSLTHLQLRVSDLGDASCAEIVRSGLLGRLKVLDLRHGVITDEGARILAGCPDVQRLELLDLSRNQLTEAGITALQTAGCNVRADAQYNEEEIELEWYIQEGDAE